MRKRQILLPQNTCPYEKNQCYSPSRSSHPGRPLRPPAKNQQDWSDPNLNMAFCSSFHNSLLFTSYRTLAHALHHSPPTGTRVLKSLAAAPSRCTLLFLGKGRIHRGSTRSDTVPTPRHAVQCVHSLPSRCCSWQSRYVRTDGRSAILKQDGANDVFKRR